MKRRLPSIALPAAAATMAAAVALSTASAQTGTCTSVYTYRAVEPTLQVSSDLTVRLRNPYGPSVNIGRYFVQFRIVYASDADRAKVASVQWALDGEPNKWKRGGGRDAYLFGSFHLTEGAHTIDVTITPASGSPVTGHINFTATRCQPMSFAAEAEQRKPPGHQPFAFWVYAGTTPMRRIDVGGKGAQISTAVALRGQKVGELRLGATPKSSVALRLPSRWSDPRSITLLRRGVLRVVLHPGRRRFLSVTGLPAGNATNVSLSFGGPRGFGLLPSSAHGPQQAGTPGLIGTRRRCQRITWDAWVAGATGPDAHATSRQPLVRECRG
jgi:hypothetical protein